MTERRSAPGKLAVRSPFGWTVKCRTLVGSRSTKPEGSLIQSHQNVIFTANCMIRSPALAEARPKVVLGVRVVPDTL
jgi:hypothetical protein